MTRNRSSAKQAGTRFERIIADHLATAIDDRIDRRVKNGAKDRGDISGVRLSPALGGGRIAIECKDCTRYDIAGWLREAAIEAQNDDATAGLVIAKRRGIGDPGEQLVLMTVNNLVALIIGTRAHMDIQ